jgi:hypothetical protein
MKILLRLKKFVRKRDLLLLLNISNSLPPQALKRQFLRFSKVVKIALKFDKGIRFLILHHGKADRSGRLGVKIEGEHFHNI